MKASANHGDLARLQAQLCQWESRNTDDSVPLEERLGFKLSPPEIEEVHRALGLPFPPPPRSVPGAGEN